MVDVLGKVLDMDSKHVKVDDVQRIIQEIAPDIWKRVYTKHIDNPGTHVGFKYVAVTLGSAIIESCLICRSHIINVGVSAGILERFDYPTYYVSSSLYESLKHVRPPSGMLWKDVFLPFDGMIFMLPNGSTTEPGNGFGIPLVGICKFKAGDTVTIPGTAIKVNTTEAMHNNVEDRISIFWCTQSGLITQDCTFPVSQPLEPSPGWIEEKTKLFHAMNGITNDAPDAIFTSWIAGVVANMILVMQARKELYESGSRMPRKLGNGTPVHSPTWIGRKYEIIREERRQAAGATTHFSELGWRSGYIRRQHHGEKNSLTKLSLIDPYIAFSKGLVAGGKE